jgi:hypothetical protein
MPSLGSSGHALVRFLGGPSFSGGRLLGARPPHGVCFAQSIIKGVLKFLLLSILLLTFLLPAYAARIRDPRRALVSALVSMAFAELGYAFFLYVLYPRLV